MFNQKNGDRPGVPNIGIIVTDGRSAKPDDTSTQAKLARKAGINLFSVGVGSAVSLKELNAIATDPDKDHVLTVSHFDKLAGISALFTQKACQGITHIIVFGYKLKYPFSLKSSISVLALIISVQLLKDTQKKKKIIIINTLKIKI